MNLVDLLAPKILKPQQGVAEVAEVADNQQRQGLRNPPLVAESGGKPMPAPVIRQNPPPLAESETQATTTFPPTPPNPPPLNSKAEIPLPVTREYFASQGAVLLPEDLAFLRWHLPKGTTARNEAIRQYLDAWRKGMEIEPVAHRKENAGRRAANSGLHSRRG
ncbi:hypothetical protein [Haliea sp. E17]|uniref:hypothetical protein n=1 Tax=Haliea sp. E17 TaxID=3401576 RepID=UPI003AB0CEC7